MTERSSGKKVKPGEAWITARVPEWAEERLKQWANQQDRSGSWIIRWLLLTALENKLDEQSEPLKMPEIDK